MNRKKLILSISGLAVLIVLFSGTYVYKLSHPSTIEFRHHFDHKKH